MEKIIYEKNRENRAIIYNKWMEIIEKNEDFLICDMQDFIEDLEKNEEFEKAQTLKIYLVNTFKIFNK